MDSIYNFLESKLNSDIVYLIKREVERYNIMCNFKICLEQILDIKKDYFHYYKYEDEVILYKFILEMNKYKMELK